MKTQNLMPPEMCSRAGRTKVSPHMNIDHGLQLTIDFYVLDKGA